ncbi:21468_t:CDS:2 [Dentiscutata erythropus]|uniref:21468_t:CDS:1 n=1 Tax=Dentiscutata erythropus TaxID=1348616 RepID=A0A9N9P614_9GLOM|nr:21468_t:CDS:2 [Dentiscutata erythropus]
MIPIPPLLLFPGLIVRFSVLFTNSYLVYKTILHDNTTKRHSLERLNSQNYFKEFLKHKRSIETLIFETSNKSRITAELFLNLFFFASILYERINHMKFQNFHFKHISTRIINTEFNKIHFYSKYNQPYKITNNRIDENTYSSLFSCRSNRMINNDNLSQSLNFEVYKIIESSLSIYHNQFYKVPSPNENRIISLHYSDYSPSDIEILFSEFQSSLQTQVTNQCNSIFSYSEQIPTECRKNKIILINNIQDTETKSINQEPEKITKPNMSDNKIVYTPMDFVIKESNQIDQVDELINKTKLLKDEIEGFLSEVQKLGIWLMNLESSHRIIKEIKALRNRCENIGTIRCLHGVNA